MLPKAKSTFSVRSNAYLRKSHPHFLYDNAIVSSFEPSYNRIIRFNCIILFGKLKGFSSSDIISISHCIKQK